MKISKLITPILGLTTITNNINNYVLADKVIPYCYITPCGSVYCLDRPGFFPCRAIVCDYPVRLSAVCCNDVEECNKSKK
jgi:hypothetical protein